MTVQVLLASTNPHKLVEFRRMLEPAGFDVIAPGDLGIDAEVEETGSTFEENAMLKAEAFSRAGGITAIADDSGLEVDALGGEPGVRSARYGGIGASDADRNRLVLDRLQEIPTAARTARFVAALAVTQPGGSTFTVRGTVEGLIADAERGAHGFGYDPIFYYPPAGRTFGQLSAAEKDAVSHRGRALSLALDTLRKLREAGILDCTARIQGNE